MSNISGIIKSIQDIMRKDVGVDGDAQRISQLVWMFFLKIYDDREEEIELLEDDYSSPLPEHLRWRNWATNPEGITGDSLSDFVNLELFPILKDKLTLDGPTGQRAQVIRNVFEDAYNYMKSGTLMRQVINKICEINFNNTQDRHTFGSIYEQILKDLQSAGNAGEFYTPRAVTQFIVNRVDPQLGESVLDPACGTGGFLSCTIDHKRSNYVKSAQDEETLIHSIRGVEKKALPHMLCTTNMILHGIDTPTQIRHDNTLSRPYKDYGNKDRVDVIVTNPPFGGTEEDGIENNFPANLRTRETADLFMALIVKLLKDKGRAAVVLPDGFLFGEGTKTRLRIDLLTQCHLHTIIRLQTAYSIPIRASKPTSSFSPRSPRASIPPPKRCGSTSTPTQKASSITTKPNQCDSRSSRPRSTGGEARKKALHPALKPNRLGKLALKTSSHETSTSTSATPMLPSRSTMTPMNFLLSTTINRIKSRVFAIS